MDWIAVTDGLPQDGQQVMTYLDWSGMAIRGKAFHDIHYYRQGIGFVNLPDDEDRYGGVTHWMPLPQPPATLGQIPSVAQDAQT